MAIENSENWYLRKYDNGEIFGPIPFAKIKEWTGSAQVSPQDMLSTDKTVWTKAPMIPELKMDWLVVVGEELLYGPTNEEALLEFVKMGEITPDTPLINSCTEEKTVLSQTKFYIDDQNKPAEEEAGTSLLSIIQPNKGGIRTNLQKRVRELELSLLEKRRQLTTYEETISKLEMKVAELEGRLRDIATGRKG